MLIITLQYYFFLVGKNPQPVITDSTTVSATTTTTTTTVQPEIDPTSEPPRGIRLIKWDFYRWRGKNVMLNCISIVYRNDVTRKAFFNYPFLCSQLKIEIGRKCVIMAGDLSVYTIQKAIIVITVAQERRSIPPYMGLFQ